MTRRWSMKRRLFPYIVGLALVMLAGMTGVDAGDVAPRVDAETADTAVKFPGGPEQVGKIPDEAIRFRVLAHSNTVADQWVKQRVKEAVIPEMERWLKDASDAREVRRRIQERLGDIQALADGVLREHGFLYRSQVTFGEVAFPAATYLNQRFAAGRYEALRITLGDGRGDNFWCVMFPPLCFGSPADPWGVTKAEAVGNAIPEDNQGKGNMVNRIEGYRNEGRFSEPVDVSGDGHFLEKTVSPEDDGHPAENAAGAENAQAPQLQVELRIFLWDWIRGWFA